MSENTQKGFIGFKRLSDSLECAKTDSHLLRFCGMPSEDSSRTLTFQVILGDLYHYLVFGGLGGYPIQSITPTVFEFIDCINTFVEIVGFPERCWGEFELAVTEGDSEALAQACRNAIDAIRQ